MRKLLIASPSSTCSHALKELLKETWEVHVCTDGYTAVDAMRYLKPEALVLNLNMPGRDGLSILEELFPNLPATLALTPIVNEYVARACLSFGVQYLMQSPSPSAEICKRLEDIYAALQVPPTATMRHLQRLGLSPHLDGYRYLLAAVPFFAADRSRPLHKEVYPYVMEVCSASSVDCVEHSIRHSIKEAWKEAEKSSTIEIWAQYFPTCSSPNAKCPNNKRFIEALAQRL